ncbi:MAG: ABC transporter ATP-binding protein [Phycisphaerales bacterium]
MPVAVPLLRASQVMIEAHAIVKRFGRVLAVDRVSFAVPARSVCGFLGPNGAGKSTSIRMVVGAMAPDEGGVLVGGRRMEPGAEAVRRAVGYLPEESPVTPDLTVEEFVRFRAELWGVPRAARGAAVDRALARCNVTDVRRRLCGQLSKGYRQRVGMAAAIVHAPAVLVLDEPTSGLDPAQVRDFRALVRSLAEESTVLLSSHVLAEVEASCDRAVLIDAAAVRRVRWWSSNARATRRPRWRRSSACALRQPRPGRTAGASMSWHSSRRPMPAAPSARATASHARSASRCVAWNGPSRRSRRSSTG